MQNASRAHSASVEEELCCKKCNWPLVKEGNLKCSRCDQETPAVLTLEEKDFRCPHCQEQGYRKPKCLAKESQVKCPNCGTLNSLKEKGMVNEKVKQAAALLKELPEQERETLLEFEQIKTRGKELIELSPENGWKEKALELLEKALDLTKSGGIKWEPYLVKDTLMSYAAEIDNIEIRIERGYYPSESRYGASFMRNYSHTKRVPEQLKIHFLEGTHECFAIEARKELANKKMCFTKQAKATRDRHKRICRLWINLYKLADEQNNLPQWLKDM